MRKSISYMERFEDPKIALIEGIVAHLVENRTRGDEAKYLLKGLSRASTF